jgi:DNA modification methylase
MEIKATSIEMVDVNSLIPYQKNMNQHTPEQIDRLVKLIEYQGFRDSIIVQKGTNIIAAGHGRVLAAKKMGMNLVPVTYQEFESEAQFYAFVVSHNAIAKDSWASLDLSAVNTEMLDLGPDFDIDMLGIKDFVIEPIEKFEPQSDEDAVPDVVHPITRKGDIWLLGNHRLMCGDSTMIDDVEKLMNGTEPEFVHTDPPYGMNAVSNSSVLKKNYGVDILGDDNPDVAKDSFTLIHGLYPDIKQVWWGANYYSSALPDSECWLVWDKNNGQSDQTDCELAWANFRSVVRQFTQSSEKTNRIHPTQKPVSLVEWVLDRFKQQPKTIADFFGGSGVTLITAEKRGIASFLMEFDPKFTDAIIKRWEAYTGKKATLELTNQTYEELKAERDGIDVGGIC